MRCRQVALLRASAMVAGLTALASLACSPGAPPRARFRLQLDVAADDDTPLPGATIWNGGVRLGVTGPDGSLRTSVRAREGTTVQLRTECPAGYRAPRGTRSLTLRTFDQVAGVVPPALALVITCEALERSLALVVKTNGRADLPIVVGGQEVARTNHLGVGHLVVRTTPNGSFTARLDTDQEPQLRPRNPAVTFEVAGSQSVFVFDQDFTEAEPAPPPRRKRRRRRKAQDPGPVRPQKIVQWRPLRGDTRR